MAKTSTQKTPTFFHQDQFDKATIRVIHELQKHGFCKSVSKIEEHLGMPKRNLLQALAGQRHVSKTYRSKLLQFFVNNYNVNPLVFSKQFQQVFNGEPPTLEEQQETYFAKNGGSSNVLTMGDFAQIERLRQELADKTARVKELEKEVKHWRTMAEKLMTGGKTATTKTGQKNGQKRKA